MRIVRVRSAALVGTTIAALALAAPPAHAAGRGTELGLDAGVAWTLSSNLNSADAASSDDILTVAVPARSVRAGFFVSEHVQLEPSLGFALASFGGETNSLLEMGLDVLFSSGGGPGAPEPYLSLGGRATSFDGGGNVVTQYGIAGGFGLRFPQGDTWAIRLEVGGARLFENEDEAIAAWQVIGTIGFSFFTGA
jgi:hypothetical protein